MDLYKKQGIGGIVRMTREGKDREVFAWGVRNSVGMDINPKDKTVWFTDNQVDGMGDDTRPGELNRADKPGMNFGFPYFGGGKVRTTEYKDQQAPADVTHPQVEMAAHAADLGMSFYTGRMFPAEVSRRHLQRAAWFVESHDPGRRARDVHEPEGRRRRRQDGSLCGRMADR